MARRPDRVALWAVFMALFAAIAAAASAQAGSGGIGPGGGGGGGDGGGGGGCSDANFGSRTLRLGDCGDDVKVLNWILKSKDYEQGVPLDGEFVSPTDKTVRIFQRRRDLNVDGVVGSQTRDKLVRSMPKDLATWYGPGFFGNRTACGKTLHRDTVGVAHRKLPCGTRVTFGYRGRFLRTRVIDRGPFANGAKWDLTQKAARQLNFTETDEIRKAVVR